MLEPITERQLDLYKLMNPADSKLQKLTLEELKANTEDGVADWVKLPQKPFVFESDSWTCEVGQGFVIYDCLCLILGIEAQRAGTTEDEAKAVAKAAAPILPNLQQHVQILKNKDTARAEKAQAVFGVIQMLYSSGCLGSVLDAFFSSLPWHSRVLYGASSLSIILKAMTTDGAAAIAMIMIQLATAGFMISDSIHCAEGCSY